MRSKKTKLHELPYTELHELSYIESSPVDPPADPLLSLPVGVAGPHGGMALVVAGWTERKY